MYKRISKTKLMAVSVYGGVITYIMPNGNIGYFAQRGIHSKLTPAERLVGIQNGIISPDVNGLREVPRNVSLSFEEPRIQGRVPVSFPVQMFRQQIRMYT